MKTKLSAALLLICLLFGCKEKSVVVDLGLGPKPSDTTYLSTTVEPAQPRVVLIEECTGVSCPPCPKAHVTLASLKDLYGDRLAVLEFQLMGLDKCDPVQDANLVVITRHDNRTQIGTDLITDIYGKVNEIPGAGIDRIVTDPDNKIYIRKDYWPTGVADRLAVPTVANVSLHVDFNNVTKQLVVKVHIAYTSAFNKKQKLNVALIEDKIIDVQKKDLDIINDYEHEHVVRDILTDATATGSIMMKGISITAGRVYERTFVYDMSGKTTWNPDNMQVVAYVTNAEPGDHEVQQAAFVKLK